MDVQSEKPLSQCAGGEPESRRGLSYWVIFSLGMLLVCLTYCCLARGSLTAGVQFDEVFRFNNLIPLFEPGAEPYNQSICTLRVAGLKIPLVYKNYVSTLSVLPYAPAGFFDDYVYGRRVTGMALNMLAVCLLCLSLAWRLRLPAATSLILVVLTGLLVVSNPLVYSGGIVDPLWHLAPVAVVILALPRSVEALSARRLFLLALMVGLTINVSFYSIWIAAAGVIAAVLLAPRDCWKVVRCPKKLTAMIVGLVIGAANYVLYNIMSGFRSVMPLFDKLFRPEQYARHPIDMKSSAPLSVEIPAKLQRLDLWMGDFSIPSVILWTAIGLTTLCLAIVLWRRSGARAAKLAVLPVVLFLLVFGMILISPNTTRSGHYMLLSPFLELTGVSVVVSIFVLWRPVRWAVAVAMLLLAVIVGGNVYASWPKGERLARVGGTGRFSPAISDLHRYLLSHNIRDQQLAFLQWGFNSQLYCFNKGHFRANSWVFPLMGQKASRQQIMEGMFLSKVFASQDLMYFPLYHSASTAGDESESLLECLRRTVTEHGGSIRIEQTFFERDGRTPVMVLYAVTGISSIRRELTARLPVGSGLTSQPSTSPAATIEGSVD